MIDPDGRTVMVSGANRGMGRALARRFHADGYRVSVGGRDLAALRTAMDGLDADRVLAHRFDAADAGSGAEWVGATTERFGSIDVVVNNAGTLDDSSLEDLTDDALDSMWEVNVKAPLRLVRDALPQLRASGTGRIVNVASLSGLRVKGTFAPGYAMTKHAVIALSEATKQATWDDGIRVTAVCPGFVATDMTAGFGEDPATMIDPDDLAEVVSTVVALPNSASVARLTVACRLEPHF
ncbi:SDR family NAD(P)-dependent oxidoreductase [Ilumatobacter sp.]|uniref:SDR family NAD(P)-dependent oxidoreductase n=1 Tax=Ilumatobacter sp. TaxID=1967498 RepID=UPI003B524542